MAAIPGAYYTDINLPPSVANVTCDLERKVAVDSQGQPLCYELSIEGEIETQKVIVADVCAGNCASNVKLCSSEMPDSTSCDNSGSCLDCGTTKAALEKQLEQQWRCVPAMDCYEQTNPGLNWQDKTGIFLGKDLGLTQTTVGCELPGTDFIPSGLFPNGFVDYCSGENAHFDIQTAPVGSPFLENPRVINYQRIDCPF